MTDPYTPRIKQLRHRIHAGKGNIGQEKGKLGRLRTRRYDYLNPIPKKPEGTLPEPAHTPEPMPWNAQYETTVNRANTDLSNTNLQLQNEETATRNNYGFDDPTANPYSQAALLQRSFNQNQNQATNSYAARGQLYSGALSNALDQGRFNMESDYNRTRGAYEGELRDIAGRRLGAAQGHDETIAQAEAQRLQDALSERPDPSLSPPPAPNPKAAIYAHLQKIHAQARTATGAKRKRLSKREAELRSQL